VPVGARNLTRREMRHFASGPYDLKWAFSHHGQSSRTVPAAVKVAGILATRSAASSAGLRPALSPDPREIVFAARRRRSFFRPFLLGRKFYAPIAP
jgi:hypothetical protein